VKQAVLCAVDIVLTSASLFATNGMMLESYGEGTSAMGGTAVAYDSGNSGALNNPATLSLMNTDNYLTMMAARRILERSWAWAYGTSFSAGTR
jgi:long-chain fatty acid transport protein